MVSMLVDVADRNVGLITDFESSAPWLHHLRLHNTSQPKTVLLSNSQSTVARYRGVSWQMRSVSSACDRRGAVGAFSP